MAEKFKHLSKKVNSGNMRNFIPLTVFQGRKTKPSFKKMAEVSAVFKTAFKRNVGYRLISADKKLVGMI